MTDRQEVSNNPENITTQENQDEQVQFYQFQSDHSNSDYDTYNTDFEYINDPFKFIKKFNKHIKKQYGQLKDLIKNYKCLLALKLDKNSIEYIQKIQTKISQLRLLLESQEKEYEEAKQDIKWNIFYHKQEKKLLNKCLIENSLIEEGAFDTPQNSIVCNKSQKSKQKRVKEIKQEYLRYKKLIQKQKQIQLKNIKNIQKTLKLLHWQLQRIQPEIRGTLRQIKRRKQITNSRQRLYKQSLQCIQRSQSHKKDINKRQQILLKNATILFDQHFSQLKSNLPNQKQYKNNKIQVKEIQNRKNSIKQSSNQGQQDKYLRPKMLNKSQILEQNKQKTDEIIGFSIQNLQFLQAKSTVLLNKKPQVQKSLGKYHHPNQWKNIKKVYFK